MTVERANRYLVLASAVAGNFGQFGARVAISPFVLVIAAEFGRTESHVGAVLGLMWAVYACFQYPAGALADSYGERRVILTALGLTVLGGSLVAWAPAFPVFAAAAVVLGGGAGLYFTAGTSLLDRRFAETAQAFSVHSAGGPLAGLVIPIVAAAVATQHGWRAGILTGVAGAGLAFLLVAVAVGPTPALDPEGRVRDRLSLATMREMLGRPTVAFSTALGVVGMFVFQSFVSFFPAFLQAHHGLSVSAASQATGVAFVLIAVTLPLVGRFADQVSVDAGLVIPFLVTAVGFATLLVPAGSLRLWAGVGLVGVGLTWGGALQARYMQGFSEAERGTGFGLVRTATVLLGASGNVVTGVLADSAGWDVAVAVLAGLLVLAALAVVGNRLLGPGY